MAMREECKHFQSRTYDSGEVARFCSLDLAPDAPWKCPENCPSYQPRMADVGWEHGSLVEPAIEDMPPVPDDDAATLLDSAEDIVNAAGPAILADVEAEEARQQRSRSRWWRKRR
ncbi:MAG: hypothetical protein M0Z62_12070 [Actinomycetota bacterium]|jgi:hypothetical protein|nr:hypothetical protein [Actinomycetota bacterium]